MFEILNTDSINAFSCPGGYILITRGALELAKNEAELAAIIGHEIAHVGRRHMMRTLVERSKAQGQNESISNQDSQLSSRRRALNEGSAFADQLSRFLVGASSTGLSVIRSIEQGMSLMLKDGLSQEMEFEADRDGLKISSNAGYDPQAFLQFLMRLKEKNERPEVATLSKTHPPVQARISAVSAAYKGGEQSASSGARGENRFDLALKNLRERKRLP